MAADDYGTAHLYGIATTYPNATVESFSFDEERVNYGEVANESGNVIERRYDDTTKTGTLTLIIRSGTVIPNAASEIQLLNVEGSNINVIATKVGRASVQKDFRKVTIEFITSEAVSL